MAVPKLYFLRTLVPPLLTGAGVSLGFTVLEEGKSWLLISVAVTAIGVCPVLAGWFSPRLRDAALFPVVTAASPSLAFAAYGVGSSDVNPIPFTIALSVMYGGLASGAFAAGWMARSLVRAGHRGREGL